jgi:phosphoribosylglycinamide formyltransferase-1
VDPNDTLDIIKFKGQQLEHQYFPKIIENLIKKM